MERVVQRTVMRIRGLSQKLRTHYAVAFGAYSLLAAPFAADNWPLNTVLVVSVGVLVPLVILLVDWVRRAENHGIETPLEPDETAREALDEELTRGRNIQGREPWWGHFRSETRWFDNAFAFWWKSVPMPADGVRFEEVPSPLIAPKYNDVPVEQVEPARPGRSKAALVDATGLLSDQETVIRYRRNNWELVRWVEHNYGRFMAANRDNVSVFGVPGMLPHPSILCSHNVVETADGWVLFSLRSTRADYYPETWSVSFEEQVEVGEPGPDHTLTDTVTRGIYEELGCAVPGDVASIQLMAIAREFDLGVPAVRGGLVVTWVLLSIKLETLWDRISESAKIPDKTEHSSWMACHFTSRVDVEEMLRTTHVRTGQGLGPEPIRSNGRLPVPVAVHPDSHDAIDRPAGYGWHPTSRMRLRLWSLMAVHERRLSAR